MNLLESFKIAFRSLSANKLRSFLTTLGVIIGIFAVVTLVSIGEAGKAYIYYEVSKFGTGSTYIEVQPGKETGLAGMMSFLDSTLTREDVKAISRLNYVRDSVGFMMQKAKLKFGRHTFETSFLMGVNHNLQNVLSHKVVTGRFFTRLEDEQRRKYVIIGPAIAKDLFGSFSPIGEKIKINGVRYTVIGLLEEKGTIFGTDYDSIAYIPISAAESLFNTKKVMEIGITAIDEKKVSVVVAEIKKRLMDLHGKEDFKVVTQTEMLDIVGTIMGALTGMIGGIAAISLLVGGIGIMNIMLVTVIERTREVGIRKAVGARNHDILYQFLAESILISLVGGVIGMLFGVTVSLLIMKFIRIPAVIATWAALLAIVVSVVVGIASGLYPSMRAARLSPIEALRYE